MVFKDRIPPPHWQRADQILTSYLFNLTSARSKGVAADIAQYSALKAKARGKGKLTEKESHKLDQLKHRLEEELGSAETDLQRKVETAVSKTLHDMAQDWLEKAKPDSHTVELEIRRQLRELLDLGEKDDQD